MKVIFIVGLTAAMFATILSSPQGVRPVFYPANLQQTPPEEIPDAAKEVILEYLAEKMDEAYPNLVNEVQARTGSLFNLSAYLNTNRPANTTALTFVPLITLLTALG